MNLFKSKPTIYVYTDGGINGNPGDAGAGIYIIFPGYQQEISKFVGVGTNNFAELRAIEEALIELKKMKNKRIVLFSDSKYSIGALNKNWKLKKNQDLIARIKLIMLKFRDLRMIHVKGHAGIYGNEKADKLASLGKNKILINRGIKNKNFI